MFFYKKKKKIINFFFFLFTIIIILAVLNYVVKNEIASFIKKSNNYIISYFHKNFSYWKEVLDNFRKAMDDQLQYDLTHLKNENFLLKNRINHLESLAEENSKLKGLLSFKTNFVEEYVFSQVISYNPQNQFFSLNINKGSKHGIKEGASVIAFKKDRRILVGFILNTGNEISQIQSIFDKQTQISVKIENEEKKGILNGRNFFNKTLIIKFVDISLKGLIDKEVYTLGWGGKYPANILIGKTIAVNKKNYGLFQEVEVLPYLNLFNLNYVLVLKKND